MGRHSSQDRRLLRRIVKEQGVEKFSDTIKRKLKNKHEGSGNLRGDQPTQESGEGE